MGRFRVVSWSLLASVFAWADQASAGWVIDEVVKGGEGGRQQVMLQANRMKTVMLSEGGRPTAAFILDLNAQTITQVDYQERDYMTAAVQKFVRAILEVQREASAEMQEALKQLPPEERKVAEQMMRSQMPQVGSAQACREPRIEMRKTGQQATIAGYPAVRYDVLVDGKPESEFWIAKGVTAWREVDPQKLERFGMEMAKLAGCDPSLRSDRTTPCRGAG